MESALRARSARADVLAQNVANADTPNYVSRDLKFEDMVRKLVQEEGDVDKTQQLTIAAENLRADGNDVDLTQALTRVYENALNFYGTLRLYRDSLNRIKMAAS